MELYFNNKTYNINNDILFESFPIYEEDTTQDTSSNQQSQEQDQSAKNASVNQPHQARQNNTQTELANNNLPSPEELQKTINTIYNDGTLKQKYINKLNNINTPINADTSINITGEIEKLNNLEKGIEILPNIKSNIDEKS